MAPRSSALKGAVAAAALATATGSAVELEAASTSLANPVRKVVTMLQAMKHKIESEGEKEEQLFEKYMCYCKTSGGDLSKTIAEAEAKSPQVGADIQAGEAKKAQLDEDLAAHRADRKAAKEALAAAEAVRAKEAAAFAAEKAEADANIAAITKAVAALEKGMAGGFLQTPAAERIRGLLQSRASIADMDRQTLAAFLDAHTGYSPQSGEVTGILKELGDEMARDLSAATADEKERIAAHADLTAAKNKEVAALTTAIEDKSGRAGELAVSIVNMKNDLSDTEAALLEDKKFLADLEKNCDTKSAEWDEVKKTRAEELVALSETIKVLQDDDALDLFKKTLPSASAAASLVQVTATADSQRAEALAAVHAAQRASPQARQQLAFVALALQGRKAGFDKVLSMIDNMVSLLKKEQTDDDAKKDYCGAELDRSDDKRKDFERAAADSEKAIAATEDAIATFAGEIKALTAGIKDLDASVAEATELRKAEHSEFQELMAQDSAAKQLLGVAKNRLNKFYNPAANGEAARGRSLVFLYDLNRFYNPKLYLPPPKRQLSEEERIVSNFGGSVAPTPAPGGIAGTGVAVLAQVAAHHASSRGGRREAAAPPPPPEAVGAYAKKTEESAGVIAMIDMLVKDLDKEMTTAETAERDAQGDYEQAMRDSAEKRAMDAKALADKNAAKADGEAALQTHKDAHASATNDLAGLAETISALHGECDWLLQYFDARKEARSSEVEALGRAKAVLSGAGFSLAQVQARSLRGRA